MSNVLLDFVDRLVGDDDSKDGTMTTGINALNSFVGNENVTDSFCSVPTEIFENFTAEEFSNTDTIEWMHSLPPRFGHSKNVMDLVLGTNEQKKGVFVCVCVCVCATNERFDFGGLGLLPMRIDIFAHEC